MVGVGNEAKCNSCEVATGGEAMLLSGIEADGQRLARRGTQILTADLVPLLGVEGILAQDIPLLNVSD